MSDRHEKLESWVAQLARSQPPRRAPASLQAHVLARLAAQPAAIPWWSKGFAHWPPVVRAAFLIGSCGFAWLAVAGLRAALSFVGSREVAGTALSWVQPSAGVLSALVSVCADLVSAIPPLWMYGLALFGLALYALLFGLGTFAYRTLCVER